MILCKRRASGPFRHCLRRGSPHTPSWSDQAFAAPRLPYSCRGGVGRGDKTIERLGPFVGFELSRSGRKAFEPFIDLGRKVHKIVRLRNHDANGLPSLPGQTSTILRFPSALREDRDFLNRVTIQFRCVHHIAFRFSAFAVLFRLRPPEAHFFSTVRFGCLRCPPTPPTLDRGRLGHLRDKLKDGSSRRALSPFPGVTVSVIVNTCVIFTALPLPARTRFPCLESRGHEFSDRDLSHDFEVSPMSALSSS